MNEHAGPACALSGLIVGIFAVLLHDNTAPPSAPISQARGGSSASTRGGASSKPETPPAIRPTPPGAIASSPMPSEPVGKERSIALPAVEPRQIPIAVPEPSRTSNPELQPVIKVDAPTSPPKKPSPAFPRPSFAIVEQGESLADVAARVYGSKEATEALWKANRDQVERVDSALARGTLLRVP